MTEKKSTPTTRIFVKDSHIPSSLGQKSYTPTSNPQGNHTPTSQGGPKTPAPAPKKK